MAEDGRKKSLPEQKRLVREAIRKLTDATLTEEAAKKAPSARAAANGRAKIKLPAGERYTGRDA
jgi:hypothetical protein